ncbi:MAG: heme ABC exporter ATP-binding protein CcmA [Firmicutes bacterium]|nr:heme ABC exporter ATP-binding protein CcmA [Bacillota bacterium]
MALEARQVRKHLGAKNILAGVDLGVEEGRFLTLFGPNGAGKSTLLRILAGLVPVSGGTVLVKGKPIAEAGPALRRLIGFLSHGSFLYDTLTARQNLMFYGRLYGVAGLEQRVEELLDQVELSLFANDPVRGFSRGMIQRLAIARAIIHRPGILLLDEPYTGLDQRASEILDAVLRKYKELGHTVVMVSHSFSEGLAQADELAVLHRGRIVTQLPRGDLDPAEWARQYRQLVG